MLKDYTTHYVGIATFLTEFDASEAATITEAPSISRSLCTSPLVRFVVNRDVLGSFTGTRTGAVCDLLS